MISILNYAGYSNIAVIDRMAFVMFVHLYKIKHESNVVNNWYATL